jgi:hypothetical protein
MRLSQAKTRAELVAAAMQLGRLPLTATCVSGWKFPPALAFAAVVAALAEATPKWG